MARQKIGPVAAKIAATGHRIRRDKVDRSGRVTLRDKGTLHHIGAGNAYACWRVVLLVRGLDIQVIGFDASPLRHLTLDPSLDYRHMPSGVDLA
jgi:hypothetical protein